MMNVRGSKRLPRHLALGSVAATLALASIVALATPKIIILPPDGAQLRPSTLPGYAKAQTNCVGCHSAEYMLFQPPNAGRPYWDTMTKRMKAVFLAPIDDADIAVIVDYLAATYGNQKP